MRTHTVSRSDSEVSTASNSSEGADRAVGGGWRSGGFWLGITRIALGWVFAWAFVDKLFGLGKATPSARAWLNGGSPTTGFLKGVTGPDSKNPFKGFFEVFMGHAWADWLFMLGLAGIGGALILGVAMRLAAASAAVLLTMMWMASLPIATNPFLDDHLVYALLGILLATSGASRHLGLGAKWAQISLVRKHAWLR